MIDMLDKPGFRERPPVPAWWLRGEARRRLPRIAEEVEALRRLAADLEEVENRRARQREIWNAIQLLEADMSTCRDILDRDPLSWDDLPPVGYGAR